MRLAVVLGPTRLLEILTFEPGIGTLAGSVFGHMRTETAVEAA